MNQLTPEQAERHRQYILRLGDRISYVTEIGHVYTLATVLNMILTFMFASMPAPHLTRVFLSGFFVVFTIISAIGVYRNRRHRQSLEKKYHNALFESK